ncbi:trimethylamine methyltransferase family protein [Candidatus Leptofilum sp.]|uniref:trimethylamine methyltransferase family protein n=1 Tax=Candidatus Leptofilum sp. TaxID=3241576 RepID=UPI003B5B16B9
MTRKRRRNRPRPHGPNPEKVAKITQPKWTLPPYEIASTEQLQLLHDKSMQILEEGGIAFYDDEAVRILEQHNVKVVNQIAYFDRAQVMEWLAKAPSQFVWSGRNPAHNVVVGGDNVIFAPVVGPPFVRDLDRGRRDGTLADLQNFIKLSQHSPYLHSLGAEIVVPSDIPIAYRHLETMYALLAFGDKPVMGIYHTGPISADAVKMAQVVHGEEAMRQNHFLHGVVNVSSPRRLDDRMLGLLIEFARHNQIVDVTPFILSGAMGPVSILGTVAQLNAEALAGIVFAQMVNPGTPCIYGSFQAVLDLQSGAPVFGAPESQLAQYLSAQLARMYNLPFRAAGAYASSKIIDAQGAYESVMAMFPSLLVRPNFILHAAGWLEGGLTVGYEKFVLDCELLGMYHRYLQNVSWEDDEWAMEAIINEVPPGGHHLGSSHTMRHYRTAFYRAGLFDYDSAESWEANGSIDSIQRANAKYKQLLRQYEQPQLDPATDDALRDFIERRKLEL